MFDFISIHDVIIAWFNCVWGLLLACYLLNVKMYRVAITFSNMIFYETITFSKIEKHHSQMDTTILYIFGEEWSKRDKQNCHIEGGSGKL